MKAAIDVGDAQPWTGPSMTAHTSVTMAAIDRIVPSGSKRAIDVSFELGTNSPISTRATTTTGTLIISTEPHQKCSSNQPPVTGPRATARPAVAAHTAMATARSLATVKTLTRIASVAGNISAAPTPIAARHAIRALAEPAVAPRAENVANRPRPPIRTHLRPTRSPKLPAAISRPAKTRT